MYLFSDYKNIRVPGKVQTFLQDLYSGKLHREFHYGPDPESKEEETEEKTEEDKESDETDVVEEKKDDSKHIPRGNDKPAEEEKKPKEKSTDPPESQFVHLGPSKQRYTILRDEF